ncbi:hypothetical protein ACA910_004913 [Epithemia clementina (nom. ined.)]
MEMRRRNANPDALENGDVNGSKDARRRRPVKHSRKGDQPILSLSTVLCLVCVFVGAGFLQHHFQESRGDSAGGLPLPKYIRDMQEKLQIRNKLPDTSTTATSSSSSLLSMEEDLSLERDKDGIRYHLVFSTDCSPYQHWQSYLVYFSAMLVRQPGHVTRIASGCEADQAKEMEDWFQDHVSHMSKTRFHLQLTPKFSSVKNEAGETTGGDYKFFNKPFGLKYWMEHSPKLQFNEKDESFPKEVHDDIVILIDPDMGLIRPITRDFTSDTDTVISPNRRSHILTRVVGPGKPAAQVYGFGTQWAKLNLTKVTGSADTPAAKVSRGDGLLYYPVGPPYLATVTDMYRIAQKWTEFVPKVHAQYPYLLAEMFAFCIAAAHLELPHQLISSLMVSDIESGNAEGWPLIDQIPTNQVCPLAKSLVQYPSTTTAVPNVVHMCQRYGLGSDWFFSKRAIPADSLYDCDTPLYAEPPDDVAALDFKILPPNFERKDVKEQDAKRMAFMLCYLYRLMNEAASFYKSNACSSSSSSSSPNLQKTRSLVAYMKEKSGKHKK